MLSEKMLADRTAFMGTSAIREILKVLSRPGVVSLAGGMPAPEAFPMDHLEGIFQRVLEKHGTNAMQYGTTEGFRPLHNSPSLSPGSSVSAHAVYAIHR